MLSCVEMSFVTVSKPYLKKLSQKGIKTAHLLLHLKENPERVLSVLQIGITLVGAISAAVGGAGAEEMFSPMIERVFGITEQSAEVIAIALVVIPLSYLSIVIGELVPKTLAIKYPTTFSLLGARPLVFLDKVFSPVVYILEVSTQLIVRPIDKYLKSEGGSEVTSTTVDLDPLTESHKQYVLNLIAVEKKTLKDILVPWTSVTKIDKTAHHHDVLETIRSSRHTRMPVVDENKVIGILHSKEFITEFEISKVSWPELIRPVISLGPKELILNGLKILQSNKSHMALIVDNGNILGIVTLEDIFEEVVGEIYDEDDNLNAVRATSTHLKTYNVKK